MVGCLINCWYKGILYYASDKKGFPLNQELERIKCMDDTEQIVINIPFRLAERAQKHADEHGSTVTGVVIEALDAFLSGRTTNN